VLGRSGHAFKRGYEYYTGLVDCDYRGEVAALMRSSTDALVVRQGERIAQLLVVPCPAVEIVEAGELGETGRNTSGFGSSGT
jgi:dUTP pyrophosphatase